LLTTWSFNHNEIVVIGFWFFLRQCAPGASARPAPVRARHILEFRISGFQAQFCANYTTKNTRCQALM